MEKWCPFKLIGPTVKREQALDYIARTDVVFGSLPYVGTNDRNFERQLLERCGLEQERYDADESHESRQLRWRKAEIWREAFAPDRVELEHLRSSWVATAYIGGPHGPVSPDGHVSWAMNFGKYPGEDGIESDLDKVAEAFPWLSFDLLVWGRGEDSAGEEPTHYWSLTDGIWARLEVSDAPKRFDWPQDEGVETFVLRLMAGRRTETTWDVDQLHALWPERFERARAAVKALES